MILHTLLFVVGSVSAQLVDFDSGRSSIESAVAEIKRTEGRQPSKPNLKPVKEDETLMGVQFVRGEAPGKAIQPKAGICQDDPRDCVDFIFDPKDTRTEYFPLRHTEYREQCNTDGRGNRYCSCHPQWTTNARVQIRIEDHKEPFPWERQRFRMCLERNWVYYYEIAVAFEYDANFIDRTAVVVARPKNKIPMRPDPDGISTSLNQTGSGFTLSLGDKWAGFYAAGQNESTRFEFKLKRDAFLTDPTICEGALTLSPSQPQHTVQLPSPGLDCKLKDGDKYYIEYKFQRLGSISKPDFTKSMETGKVTFRAPHLSRY